MEKISLHILYVVLWWNINEKTFLP